MAKSVTIEQVLAWEPCGLHGADDGKNYTPQRIKRLFADRDALTYLDIIDLARSGEIPYIDAYWAAMHPEFLAGKRQRYIAGHAATWDAVDNTIGSMAEKQQTWDECMDKSLMILLRYIEDRT